MINIGPFAINVDEKTDNNRIKWRLTMNYIYSGDSENFDVAETSSLYWLSEICKNALKEIELRLSKKNIDLNTECIKREEIKNDKI